MATRSDVVVVGGGVVGLCAAYYLAERGCDVTLIDAGAAGRASDGNAGMIVPSHVVPLAAPGVIAKGLRWLFDAGSPFYIKPRLSLDLLGWLWHFRAACTEAHVRRAVPILRDLSLASVALLETLAADAARPGFGYANTGLLMLYHTEKGKKENLEAAARAEAAGLDLDRLDQQATRALEPGIATPVTGSVLYRQDGRVDPDALLAHLRCRLERQGVHVRQGETVHRLSHDGRTIRRVHTSGGSVEAKEVVLAAGAWTGLLARSLGLKLPMQPAKGYSVTLRAANAPVRFPHILTEEKLTVTPMPGRLRFAGTLSLSGFGGGVDRRRTAPLLRLMRRYQAVLPGSPASAPDVWYGYRPCSPDGLPFIGRARPYRNLTVATGHGMLGVTLAPITGKLVAELVEGVPPALDVAPLQVNRYG